MNQSAHIPCTPIAHVTHTPAEPVSVQDPDSGKYFDRVTCSSCGTWLSDGPLMDYPRVHSAGLRGAREVGRAQLTDISPPRT